MRSLWLLVFVLWGCEDEQPASGSRSVPHAAPSAAETSPAADAVAETFLEVEGEALRARVRRSDADAVLLNVWATWCEPCTKELPALLRLGRELQPRGLELMLVNADFPDQRPQAEAFLQKLDAPLPSFAKSGADDAFIRALHPEWSGALPATFLFDGNGDLERFWQEEIRYERLHPMLDRWLRSARKEKP